MMLLHRIHSEQSIRRVVDGIQIQPTSNKFLCPVKNWMTFLTLKLSKNEMKKRNIKSSKKKKFIYIDEFLSEIF